jgi:minor histocompatibility antigen H13
MHIRRGGRTSIIITERKIGSKSQACISSTTTACYALWNNNKSSNKDDYNKQDGDNKVKSSSSRPMPPSISPLALVRRNLPVYFSLLILGILPFLDYNSLVNAINSDGMVIDVINVINVVRTGYFGIVAMTTVYLGAQRQDIGMTQTPVSGKRAAFAPLFAGVTLFVLYTLIKYTQFDPGTFYRIFACLFGWICLAEISQELFGLSPLGPILVELFQIDEEEQQQILEQKQQQESSQSQKQPPIMSQPVSGETEIDRLKLRAGGIPAAIFSTVIVLVYFTGVSDLNSLEQLRIVATSNNCIATAIALASLGQIALESYSAGAFLLIGLFFYDALSVFQSDTMITVATKIEAPVKFLFAGATLPEEGGKYPFGVLGLGDIVIPGIFLAMLREFDIENWWDKNATFKTKKKKKMSVFSKIMGTSNTRSDRSDVELMYDVNNDDNEDNGAASIDYFREAQTPYFTNGLVGYAVGLGTTFIVLYSTGQGQPALFYIVPSLLITSLGTAAYRNEVSELWSYEGARAREAREVQEAWKKEREQEK